MLCLQCIIPWLGGFDAFVRAPKVLSHGSSFSLLFSSAISLCLSLDSIQTSDVALRTVHHCGFPHDRFDGPPQAVACALMICLPLCLLPLTACSPSRLQHVTVRGQDKLHCLALCLVFVFPMLFFETRNFKHRHCDCLHDALYAMCIVIELTCMPLMFDSSTYHILPELTQAGLALHY